MLNAFFSAGICSTAPMQAEMELLSIVPRAIVYFMQFINIMDIILTRILRILNLSKNCVSNYEMSSLDCTRRLV